MRTDGKAHSGFFFWAFGASFPVIMFLPVVLGILLLTRGCPAIP